MNATEVLNIVRGYAGIDSYEDPDQWKSYQHIDCSAELLKSNGGKHYEYSCRHNDEDYACSGSREELLDYFKNELKEKIFGDTLFEGKEEVLRKLALMVIDGLENEPVGRCEIADLHKWETDYVFLDGTLEKIDEDSFTKSQKNGRVNAYDIFETILSKSELQVLKDNCIVPETSVSRKLKP